MNHSSNRISKLISQSNQHRRSLAVVTGLILAAGNALYFAPAGLEAHAATTETVTWTPEGDSSSPKYFEIPVGASNIQVRLWGGAGGDGFTTGQATAGTGGGGLVLEGMTLKNVTPGDVLEIYVGSGGKTATGTSGGAGGTGFASGGRGREGAGSGGGGGGGGGSTAILLDGAPIIVSAGGGGGGGAGDLGTGSGSGGNGGVYVPTYSDFYPGYGNAGSTSAGGAGGNYAANSTPSGGDGGYATQFSSGGGGGGGGAGYSAGGTGGGGASFHMTKVGGGGGGGGDSYWNSDYVNGPTYLNISSWGGGVAGQVSITYDLEIASTISATTSPVYVGETASYEVVVTPEDASNAEGEVCITFADGDSCTSVATEKNKYLISRVATVDDLSSSALTVTYTPSGAAYSVATGTVTPQVSAIPSETVLTVSPSSVLITEEATFSAQVNLNKDRAFDGIVTFKVLQAGEVVSTSTSAVDADGKASSTLSTLAAGSYMVVASYAHADGAVASSTSAEVPLVVTKQTVELNVTTVPSLSSKYADPIDVRVEVTGSLVTPPTGTVKVGYVLGGAPTELAEATLSNGVATFSTVNDWPWEEAEFTVWYLGDNQYGEASSIFEHKKTAIPTTLDVTQLPATSFVDEEVSFEVTPSLESDNLTKLDGKVSLQGDGDTELDSQETTDDSGTPVSLTAKFGEAGKHVVSLAYDDNRDFVAATVLTASHTVLKHEVDLDISGISAIEYGQDLDGAVLITPTTGTHVPSTPSGQVSWKLFSGENVLYESTPTTLVEAAATLQIATADFEIRPGSYTLEVSYGADRAHLGAVKSVPLTVKASSSLLELSVAQESIKAGQAIDLAATLTVTGPGRIAGNIEFLVDGEVVGVVPAATVRSLNSVTSYRLENGIGEACESVTVGARYVDSGGEVLSSAAEGITFSVGAVPTEVALSGNETSEVGQKVAFKITVSNGVESSVPPTGQVQLFIYSEGASAQTAKALGDPVALESNGKVDVEISNLAVGKYVIYAQYLGDDAHEAASSLAVPHEVAASSNAEPDEPIQSPSSTSVGKVIQGGKLAATGSGALLLAMLASVTLLAGGAITLIGRKRA